MRKTQKIRTQNDPTYSPHRLRNQMRRKRNAFKKHRKSFWKFQEEKLYVEYLQKHQFQFADPLQRKKSKIFIDMTNFIKIRGPDQCRSHHQKMLKKYGFIAQIIKWIKRDKLSQHESACQQDVLKQNDIELTKKYTNFQEFQSERSTKEEFIHQQLDAMQEKRCCQEQMWSILDSDALISDQKLFN